MSSSFTAEDLLRHNGETEDSIYIGVKGIIYDCTSGADFYGPGQSYSIFAGKEVSRCLGKMLIGDEEANAGWNNLSEEHLTVLNQWAEKYKEKYPVVGVFHPDPGFLVRGQRFDP